MKRVLHKKILPLILLVAAVMMLIGCTEPPRESVITIVSIGKGNRIKLGKIIRAIKPHNPKLIALDFYLVPDSADVDTLLVKELATINNTVQVIGLHDTDDYSDHRRGGGDDEVTWDSLEVNHPKFNVAHHGFSNLWGGDRYVSKALRLRETFQSQDLYAFGYVIAKNSFGVKEKFRDTGEDIVSLKMDGLGKNYKLIQSDDLISGKIERADIAGKIVLLGFIGENEDVLWVEDEGKYNGVEVHAAIIGELIDP